MKKIKNKTYIGICLKLKHINSSNYNLYKAIFNYPKKTIFKIYLLEVTNQFKNV